MTKKLSMRPGEVYNEKAESLGSAGYSWVVAENNETVTEVLIKSTESADAVKKKGIGGAVSVSIIIKAIKAGKSTITLQQKRSWEQNSPPADSITYKIEVKD